MGIKQGEHDRCVRARGRIKRQLGRIDLEVSIVHAVKPVIQRKHTSSFRFCCSWTVSQLLPEKVRRGLSKINRQLPISWNERARASCLPLWRCNFAIRFPVHDGARKLCIDIQVRAHPGEGLPLL